MSYTPINWQTGDTITAQKLNHMEDGISGGALIVNVNSETEALNKTWQEIYNTVKSGNMAILVVEIEEGGQMVAQEADVIIYVGLDTGIIPNEYKVITGYNNYYKTSSADGYPVISH